MSINYKYNVYTIIEIIKEVFLFFIYLHKRLHIRWKLCCVIGELLLQSINCVYGYSHSSVQLCVYCLLTSRQRFTSNFSLRCSDKTNDIELRMNYDYHSFFKTLSAGTIQHLFFIFITEISCMKNIN